MSKLSLFGIAGLALGVAAPALAADFPVEMPVKATFAQRFTWTGCYIGMHGGGAWMGNTVTDPVLLVQDNINLGGPGFTTVGPTTVGVDQHGAVVGGQLGCDYQAPSNFVIGIEGAASGSTLKGERLLSLPDSPPDTALLTIKTDFIPAVTGRVGYAADHWLFYAKGGVAWANSKYSLTGTFTGGRRGRARHTLRLRGIGQPLRLDRGRRCRMGLLRRLVGKARIRLLRFRHAYRDDE